MAKLRLTIRRADAERLEHLALHPRLVNTKAAAADFHSVQDDVISLGANLGKFLCLKQRHVLGFRTSERMMHRVPFVFVRAPFEKRKICDPKEIPDFTSGHKLSHLRDTQA